MILLHLLTFHSSTEYNEHFIFVWKSWVHVIRLLGLCPRNTFLYIGTFNMSWHILFYPRRCAIPSGDVVANDTPYNVCKTFNHVCPHFSSCKPNWWYQNDNRLKIMFPLEFRILKMFIFKLYSLFFSSLKYDY